jgi:hypothetical protein
VAYKIKHISFLLNGEREIVRCNRSGLFVFDMKNTSGSRYNSKKLSLSRPLKALEVVRHATVRNCDPVITLSNGDKMRVYLSGDSTHMVVQAQSILEVHDTEVIKRRQQKVKEKAKTEPVNQESYEATTLEGLFEDFPEW